MSDMFCIAVQAGVSGSEEGVGGERAIGCVLDCCGVTHKHGERQRQTDRQTDRQRETKRQTERQTDRQRQTETDRDRTHPTHPPTPTHPHPTHPDEQEARRTPLRIDEAALELNRRQKLPRILISKVIASHLPHKHHPVSRGGSNHTAAKMGVEHSTGALRPNGLCSLAACPHRHLDRQKQANKGSAHTHTHVHIHTHRQHNKQTSKQTKYNNLIKTALPSRTLLCL